MSTLLRIIAGLFSMFACLVLLAGFGNGYGTKLTSGPVELYYTDTVTEAEANSLLELLADVYADEKHQTLYFQVDATDDGGKAVRYVVVPEAWQQNEYDSAFAALELLLESQVFTGQDVEIHLCDSEFETRRSVNELQPGTDGTDNVAVEQTAQTEFAS